MKHLTTIQQFHDLITNKEDFLVFKHSTRCSISGWACREVYQAIDELKLDNIYLLDVLTTWDLKHDLAEEIWVRHESPQVLIFKKGTLTAHESHDSITKERMRQSL